MERRKRGTKGGRERGKRSKKKRKEEGKKEETQEEKKKKGMEEGKKPIWIVKIHVHKMNEVGNIKGNLKNSKSI